MAVYLENQIIMGKLDYATVVAKRTDLKEGIDTYLIEKDRQELIME
jgi:hypothetical protein